MQSVASFFDWLADRLAQLCGWAYFAIGLMLGFEVVARYFFNAPTIWAEELSRLLFIFATLLAGPALLRHNQHIRVTALTALMGPGAQRAARLAALAFVVAFCWVLVWYGKDAPLNSFERGRSSGSMLDIPAWWAQSAVPLAFGLLGIQAIIEFIRCALGAPLPADAHAPE
ncbi:MULTISPECIES: TRAP transporter small permease subunit [Marivita]|uniref:TRAP transporter small permease protein n=1 Tax=Marivita cryptomonadis TaxID=505252 RepID=A0A9Q2S6S2_9RHOB|nr:MULTISPECIES: TRAP transporter small permease [Marivita]MCR9168827.1 TRAP transporter small permease [Paracoccaceae bacterium]MBM2323461.1 TRAP transporter small permease [Marivita cryptomonadis]MBM2333047.1 TRAP transporter small permease [Marivita cryptomonadis]MBM2342627.1 TRAP transporter small permease [Marivita cryptomonadis]MBM2347295.1 TRAP transporter small permease [Marivita cryptomonadis]